jgi:hypothetical protein
MAMALQLAARRPRVGCRKAEKRNVAVARSTAARRSQEGEVASAGPWTSASAACQVSSACSLLPMRLLTLLHVRCWPHPVRCSVVLTVASWMARAAAEEVGHPHGAERMASGLVR